LPYDQSPQTPQTDRVVISVNPIAGARSAQAQVDRLMELLKQGGFRPEALSDLDAVADRANGYHAEGRLRALVGVGGDGTAAELINRTEPGLPFTMLPSGNENLFARYLGLGGTPESLCQTITEAVPLRLDAGRANGRVFLLMIGCGFDADVVRRVHLRRTGHIRSRNYFKPILASIRSYQYPQMRVYWDTGAAEVGLPPVVRWLFAFNLPCYGGGLRLAPQADGTDGLLDVCAFRRGYLWHGLRYVGGVLLRRHYRMADCTVCRVRRLRIDADAEVPYQLDGDPGGVLPVEVEVVPRRLNLIVPASVAKELEGTVKQ